MNNLILIPARSGSTRVSNKNMRELAGKPLVAHAIEGAVQAQSGRVLVSTNCEDIRDIALQYGAEVPFLRPAEISTATATSLATIMHSLLWLQEHEEKLPEIIAFIPPTNPFVQAVTVRNMFLMLKEQPEWNSIVTITEPKTHPFRIVRVHEDGGIENGIVNIEGKTINDLERSQDWPVVWEGSPACRMTRTEYFMGLMEGHKSPLTIQGKTYDNHKCLGYEISKREAFDIDTAYDFKMAEMLAKLI
jgi:CMP-N,N'-diacetyllegionaminic acid synthase